MNTEKELSYKEFVMRENNEFHAPINPEFNFYSAVKNGEVNTVLKLCKTELANKSGLGNLSEDPLQSIKYHFVITAALIARYCIEGGMEHETAYSLSDLYIMKADVCTSMKEISALHTRLCLDYTQRMKNLNKHQIISKHIVKCVDYIYDNLHTRIRISDLAAYTGLNESYLSRLFKEEMGVSTTEYIQMRKIETAKNMLKYSDYQPSQIATILCFPNQSYFIHVFKKRVGQTPKQYQNTYFQETGIVHPKKGL